jgi:hypothetical protein
MILLWHPDFLRLLLWFSYLQRAHATVLKSGKLLRQHLTAAEQHTKKQEANIAQLEQKLSSAQVLANCLAASCTGPESGACHVCIAETALADSLCMTVGFKLLSLVDPLCTQPMLTMQGCAVVSRAGCHLCCPAQGC